MSDILIVLTVFAWGIIGGWWLRSPERERNEMRKRLLIVLLLIATAMTVVYAGTALGQTDPDRNDPTYWETQFGHEARCFKHAPGEGGVHGYITEDGLAVVLYPHQLKWWGTHWEAVIVKAGTDRSVTEHPADGIEYPAPDGKEVSHWIVCKGDDTTTTTSTTEKPTTTTSPTTTEATTTTTVTTVPSSTTTTTCDLPMEGPYDPCIPEITTTTVSTTTSTTTTPTTTTSNPSTTTSVPSSTVPPSTITTLPETGVDIGLAAGWAIAALSLIGLGILTVKRR